MARRGGTIEEDDKKGICFVICPIGDDNSPERVWSDKILKYIIEPVAKPEYEVVRADKISDPGMIPTQIIRYLKEAKIVIADLTFNNPNVFYELAIRHVTKKPYIQLIRSGDKIPFDTATNRTIRIGTDVEIAEKAKSDLEKQMKSIGSGGLTADNPIAITDIILAAESTGNIEQITNAKIMESISDIQSLMYGLNQKIEQQRRIESSRKGLELSYAIRSQNDASSNALKRIDIETATLKAALPKLEKNGKKLEIEKILKVLDNLSEERDYVIKNIEKEVIYNSST
jgi:hypothetical protein